MTSYRYADKHIAMKSKNTKGTMTASEMGRRGGKSRARNNSKTRLSQIGRMGSEARWEGHIAKRPTILREQIAQPLA